jgi:ribosomal protein S18 acetylase RimI-like enzyme
MMAKPPDLTFRSATLDDLDFVSWCNYASSSPSPGFCYWDPLLAGLGVETITFIRRAVALDALAWCRIADLVIAEDGPTPVAGAARFVMREDDYRPLDLRQVGALYDVLGWSAAQTVQFESRYAAVWSSPQDETLRPSGAWTIESVAVAEHARGRGVGTALMKHIIGEARAAEIESLGVSTTVGNAAAERLYLSVGFQRYITFFSEYYGGGFPGAAKFRLRLEPGAIGSASEPVAGR